jgi:hypothetical protein
MPGVFNCFNAKGISSFACRGTIHPPINPPTMTRSYATPREDARPAKTHETLQTKVFKRRNERTRDDTRLHNRRTLSPPKNFEHGIASARISNAIAQREGARFVTRQSRVPVQKTAVAADHRVLESGLVRS